MHLNALMIDELKSTASRLSAGGFVNMIVIWFNDKISNNEKEVRILGSIELYSQSLLSKT